MRLAEPLAALLGCACVALALGIILVARSTMLREAYVSELGATGEPTERWFQAALLLVVAGGIAIGWAGRGIRSSAWIIGAWTPALSLWVGCAFFFLASQVTCTPGCPLPIGPSFTWQDFGHTAAAVLAFSAACVAMLQAAFAIGHRMLRRTSLASGVAVGVIAAAGGILSLARFGTNIGSALELVATVIALGWLLLFGAVLVRAGLARVGGVRRAGDIGVGSRELSGA